MDSTSPPPILCRFSSPCLFCTAVKEIKSTVFVVHAYNEEGIIGRNKRSF